MFFTKKKFDENFFPNINFLTWLQFWAHFSVKISKLKNFLKMHRTSRLWAVRLCVVWTRWYEYHNLFLCIQSDCLRSRDRTWLWLCGRSRKCVQVFTLTKLESELVSNEWMSSVANRGDSNSVQKIEHGSVHWLSQNHSPTTKPNTVWADYAGIYTAECSVSAKWSVGVIGTLIASCCSTDTSLLLDMGTHFMVTG